MRRVPLRMRKLGVDGENEGLFLFRKEPVDLRLDRIRPKSDIPSHWDEENQA